MEQVYNHMYHKPITHWNNANKGGGGDSGRNEITHNYDKLRDAVALKPLNGFK